MRFEFRGVRRDGALSTEWDFLLRIVGDFSVVIRDVVLYKEVDFCLVEFAVAIGNWVTTDANSRPEFVYTSVESETVGLVRFSRVGPDRWRVSAADQEWSSQDSFSTTEIDVAALRFLTELRESLLPRFDVLDHVDDTSVRATLGDRIGSSKLPAKERRARLKAGITAHGMSFLKRTVTISNPADLVGVLREIRAHLADGRLRVVDAQDPLAPVIDFRELPDEGPWPDYMESVFEDPRGHRYRLTVETYHGAGGSWSRI